MAEKNGSYAGRISHSGSQKVEAPFQSKKKSTAVVNKGDDLRAGHQSKQSSK